MITAHIKRKLTPYF